MFSSLRRPSRHIPILLVLVIVAAGAWVWHGAGSSTPVSADTALADFRARAADSPAGPLAKGAPVPGVYHFRQSGSERAGSGPLEVSRDLPARAVYIVTGTRKGYHEDLRMSAEHVEETRFHVERRGVLAAWRRTKITFLGIGEDERAPVDPISLDHPSDLAPGATWGGTYRNGDTTVTYTGRVTGSETMTLDGAPVKVAVIQTDSTFDGPHSGTRRDIVRFAPSLSLPVAWAITQTTGGESEYSIDAELELESAVPLT